MLDKRNFYINGKWVKPFKPNDFEVINPSNEEACAVISLGNKEDVNSAVKAAKESFPRWSRVEKKYKISLLEKLFKIYESKYKKILCCSHDGLHNSPCKKIVSHFIKKSISFY